MEQFIQVLIDGLATGSIYAAMALALVLIFRSTGIVNFAQGEMAMFSTFIAWGLYEAGVPLLFAVLTTIALSFIAGMVIERGLIRHFEGGPVLTLVIVTLGLFILLNSLAGWIWGFGNRSFPSLFSEETFTLGGVRLTVESIGIVVVLLGVVGLLFLLFQKTKIGLAMRAAALNPDSSALVGVRVGSMLMLGWGLAAALGALAGRARGAAPVPRREPDEQRAHLLVRRRGAGRLRQPDRRGGGRLDHRHQREPGRHLRRLHRRRPQDPGAAGDHLRRPARAPGRAVRHPGGRAGVTDRRLKLVLLIALAAAAVLIPFFFGPYRVGQFTLVLAYAVAVLGLNLLTGYNGQISLGHGAFFALGAYTAALLIEKASVPYLLSVPAAGLVCFVAGFLFGIPALRLRGLYLALVTLGLAIAMPQLIKRFDGLTDGTQGLTVTQPESPSWLPLEDDQFLYFLVLVFTVVMFVFAWNLTRGQVGRAMKSVRDAEIPASTLGVSLAATKTKTFAVSAGYAGVAGALYVFAIGFVAPEAFTLTVSFAFLAAIVVGGLATISGAILGALFIEFVPVWAADVNEALTGVIYGGVLIIFMWFLPEGAAGLPRRVRRLLAGRKAAAAEQPEETAEAPAPQMPAGKT